MSFNLFTLLQGREVLWSWSMCGSDCLDLFCVLFIRYKAIYNYKPQNSDELELREGDIVQVVEKCDDGWFVGMELFFFKPQKHLFFPSFYFLCKQSNAGHCGKFGN